MHATFENLESLLGDTIPGQYLSFLQDFAYDINVDYAIEAAGHYWSVDEFFVLSSDGRRIDEVYSAVRHALPPGTFPIVSTLGGFLIVFGQSYNDANVYYWDHEQPPGAHEITKIATSSKELAQIIVEYDETD